VLQANHISSTCIIPSLSYCFWGFSSTCTYYSCDICLQQNRSANNKCFPSGLPHYSDMNGDTGKVQWFTYSFDVIILCTFVSFSIELRNTIFKCEYCTDVYLLMAGKVVETSKQGLEREKCNAYTSVVTWHYCMMTLLMMLPLCMPSNVPQYYCVDTFNHTILSKGSHTKCDRICKGPT